MKLLSQHLYVFSLGAIYCSSFIFFFFRKKLFFPWKIQVPTYLITILVIWFANYIAKSPWHSLIALDLILLHYYCQVVTLDKSPTASSDSYLFIKVMAGTAFSAVVIANVAYGAIMLIR